MLISLVNELIGVPPEGWEFVPYLIGGTVVMFFIIAILGMIFNTFKK